MTPTQRSLNFLRRSGFLCAVVEKWNAHAGIRQDLFGWADILAAHPVRQEVWLVQTTTRPNLGSRVKKIRKSPYTAGLLASGLKVWVHGWQGPKVKQVEIKGDRLEPVIVEPRRRRRGRCNQGSLFT